VDRAIRALSDPTRREILRALRTGDLTSGEIASRFPMTAASVSHHLSVLKDADLVQAERDGRNVVYSLNTTVFHEFLEELMAFFDVGEESDVGEEPDAGEEPDTGEDSDVGKEPDVTEEPEEDPS